MERDINNLSAMFFKKYRSILNVDTDEEALEIIKNHSTIVGNEDYRKELTILKMRCGLHEDNLGIFMMQKEIANVLYMDTSEICTILMNIRYLIRWRYKFGWTNEKIESNLDEYKLAYYNIYYNTLNLSTRVRTSIYTYFWKIRRNILEEEITVQDIKSLVDSSEIFHVSGIGFGSANEIFTELNEKCSTNYKLLENIGEFRNYQFNRIKLMK